MSWFVVVVNRCVLFAAVADVAITGVVCCCLLPFEVVFVVVVW